MHGLTLLHNLLKKALPKKNKPRLRSLVNAVGSILRGGKLTLTSLGRYKQGKAKVKNKIKCIDYLLGNSKLYADNFDIQKTIGQTIIGGKKSLQIIIDWSGCPNDHQHVLRASLVSKGKSMTLYERIYPKKLQGSNKAHQDFLEMLSCIIPADCKVLIITDAGFRADFFVLVLRYGWDFEGRIRADMCYSLDEGAQWENAKDLYSLATFTAKHKGKVLLTKKHKVACNLYLYKEKKNKAKLNRNRKVYHGKMEKEHQKSFADPWLIATSLPHTKRISAKEVVKHYKKRMKIEHEFRDMKDHKWGLGLRLSRTTKMNRLQTLLLIAMLALFVFWLIGLVAEAKKLHYDYQVNTCRSRRVLSLTFLGMQIVFHNPKQISIKEMKLMLKEVGSNE